MATAMTGNTIRKGFRVQDAQLDALLEEVVQRLNLTRTEAASLSTRISSIVAQEEVDTSDLAKLASAHNTFQKSQTVEASRLSSSGGVLTWDFDIAQNAELDTTESITRINVLNAYSGRFVSLRLSSGGSHTITWGTKFKNMDQFIAPTFGEVTILTFRCRAHDSIELIGQSPTFNEYAITNRSNTVLLPLAVTGSVAIGRNAIAAVQLRQIGTYAIGDQSLGPGMSWIMLQGLRASGAATRTVVIGGCTVALPALASSASGRPLKIGTAAVALRPITAAVTGKVRRRISSAAAEIKVVAASGTGKLTRKATATAALVKVVASGAGKPTRKATASVAMPPLASSGTGTVTVPSKLLLETGDYLLLESGDKLKLEG